ncbi:MAG: hypothetical protein A3J96_08930 [Sulfurimonas sp. RIFOXYC2_FULL_36_7]|uniref:hypothetical protein n=1 Tax=Sulfurimonas sp. TaxID=2022749 RepID=UPI0008BE0003|nr:hypothetical protein [Sulfurimonas sp.]MDD3855893.1 hypothetical protein [Sulfurimonas sp.]OHE11713.1 MAG: hypothetical protein A3J96_08930 [Sulfurimonas sp. RIFOXYC2_FULL_36_7]
MQIAIYVSKKFLNEKTPIYKPLNWENRHIYQENHEGEKIQKNQDYMRVDTSKETTLEELYNDGWILKNVTNPQGFWHTFFLEKP